MKHNTRTKTMCWLLALVMLLSLVPGMSLTALAIAPEDATSGTSLTALPEDATWSANQSITENTDIGKLTVNTDITVTIAEGKTVTVHFGIDASDHTLTVAGAGTLVVKGKEGNKGNDNGDDEDPNPAESGTSGESGVTGNLVVNGATVQITGGKGGDGGNAHYYGGSGGSGGNGVQGNVTVIGGAITITGGNGGTGGQAYAGNGSNGTAGRAVTGTISGDAEESAEGDNWIAVSADTSTARYVKVTAPAPAAVTFTIVTDADQIAVDNIGTCTAEDAKSWAIANWDDLLGGDGAAELVFYSNTGELNEVMVFEGMDEEAFLEYFDSFYSTDIPINNPQALFGQGDSVYLCTPSAASAEDGPLVGTVIKVGDTLTLDGDYIECMPGVSDQVTDSFKLERMEYDDYFNGWGAVFEESFAFLVAGDETPEPDGFYVSGGNGTQSHPYTLALHYASAEAATAYAGLKNTTTVVHFDSKDWYLIDYDDDTVTLLSKECVASSKYNESGSFVEYSSNPTVKTAVDNWYNNNITAKTAVSGNAMFLLTTAQASTIYSANPNVLKCSQASGGGWWLCSQGSYDRKAAFVDGWSGGVNAYGSLVSDTLGVRPALKLDLSKVEFNSETKTFALPTPAHTHSFTYSSSNGTITATCNGAGTCSLTDNKVSFTLTAPTSLVYDGTDKKATLEGVDAFNAATGLNVSANDIVYNYKAKSSDSAVVVTETKNAGIYQALYTLQTDFPRPVAGISFTIAKANPTANDFVFSEPDNLNYDGNNKTATVIPQDGVDGMGDATVKYYSDAARTNEVDYAKNAGTYYVGITVNEGDNYNATSAVLYDSSWKFTVAKANPTANDFVFSEPDNLNYNGNNKTATVIPQDGVDGMGDATVKYFSDAARTNEVDYAKNAGTYYVGITVNEGDNYNAASAVLYDSSWKFTVAKVNPTYEAPKGLYATYGDTLADVALPTGWAWVDDTTSVGDAGTKTFKANYTPADTTNYNTVENVDVTVKVNQAEITPTVTLEGWAYGDTAKTPVVTGNSGGGTVTYTYATKNSDNFSATVPTNAGNYTVKATIAATTNYNGKTVTADFTIAKADIAPTVSLNGWTYGTDANTPVVDGNTENGNVTYTYAVYGSDSFSGAVPADAGEYTVKATIAATTNYNGATAMADFTIAKADIAPTVSIEGWTYGQEANAPSVSGNTGNGAVTYTYATKGSDSFSATVPTNAGNFTVKATVAATTNYNGGAATAEFTIAKADSVPATVTANKLTCDGTEKALVTVTGEVAGGEMQYALGKDAQTVPEDGWSTDIPAATNTGTYFVWYKVAADGNHNDSTPVCVEVTIDPNYTVKEVTGLSGNGKDEWTKGGEDGVVITVKDSGEDNSFDHFTGVKLDGQLLTKDVDYTVTKSSTIVTLLPATLEKLSVGEHTVTVLFDNGEVNTDLTVKAANSGNPTSPQTGDNSHMGLWIAIMILALCGLAATLFIGKKKRVFDR